MDSAYGIVLAPRRARRRRRRRGAARPCPQDAGRRSSRDRRARPDEGGRTIDTDDEPRTGKHGMKGLGRKSLDSLRVGVVVLDAEDHPVLVNPAARAMGLLRSGGAPGTIAAHPILRTLAGQVRRTGVRREVELDLPRGRAGGAQRPARPAPARGRAELDARRRRGRRRHRVAPAGPGPPRLRGQRQPRAQDPDRRAATARRGAAGRHRAARHDAQPEDEQSEDLIAARRFAERIHHESARMGRLVNELLELTRLQGAEPLPTPEPVAAGLGDRRGGRPHPHHRLGQGHRGRLRPVPRARPSTAATARSPPR